MAILIPCLAGVAVRVIFLIFFYDYVRNIIGADLFSLATVDSSPSHWQERIYWEKFAEQKLQNNPDLDQHQEFVPFYLEQIPYWPIKLLMVAEDAAAPFLGDRKQNVNTIHSVPTTKSTANAKAKSPNTIVDSFVTFLRKGLRLASSISAFDLVMIACDGIIATTLLSLIAVPQMSPKSMMVHALNPLAVLCCAMLSLRVIEHAVVLLLVWLLVTDEPIGYTKEGLPLYKAHSTIRGLQMHLVQLPICLLLLIMLIAMSPGHVVFLVPIAFHFFCRDGVVSFRRYLAVMCVVFVCSGYTAYRSAVGLAELPSTAPPDAGHQSYLWQILLPEIAELAQAMFVMGPIAASSCVGLQFCDPLLRQRTYYSFVEEKDQNNSDKTSDRIITPLRALIVICVLFSVVVRRYYSLIDTVFAVIVVPLIVGPHVMKLMLKQGFFIVPALVISITIPLQHTTYTSWVVNQLANANWLYFANLAHHVGLCLFCGQFILTSLRPCRRGENEKTGVNLFFF